MADLKKNERAQKNVGKLNVGEEWRNKRLLLILWVLDRNEREKSGALKSA